MNWAALKALEQSGTRWRKGWRARWSEVMLLVDTIRERARAWGLGEGGELAAAKRVDAEERLVGDKVLSLNAFMKKLGAAKRAARGAAGEVT